MWVTLVSAPGQSLSSEVLHLEFVGFLLREMEVRCSLLLFAQFFCLLTILLFALQVMFETSLLPEIIAFGLTVLKGWDSFGIGSAVLSATARDAGAHLSVAHCEQLLAVLSATDDTLIVDEKHQVSRERAATAARAEMSGLASARASKKAKKEALRKAKAEKKAKAKGSAGAIASRIYIETMNLHPIALHLTVSSNSSSKNAAARCVALRTVPNARRRARARAWHPHARTCTPNRHVHVRVRSGDCSHPSLLHPSQILRASFRRRSSRRAARAGPRGALDLRSNADESRPRAADAGRLRAAQHRALHCLTRERDRRLVQHERRGRALQTRRLRGLARQPRGARLVYLKGALFISIVCSILFCVPSILLFAYYSFVCSISKGVTDLVYKPAEAFMVGPQEFTREFYKGTKSLMQQSVYGVAHTAGKLTGTVAGLANAAMRAVATDEDGEDGSGGGAGFDPAGGGHGAFAVSKFGSDRVDGGDEGYSRMLRGAVSNVSRGLARPVQGVFDLDAKETAKSVVSLPVQVLGSLISGTLGFTARAFEGIADWSIGKRNLGMR